jgi:hypothetical protein
MVDLRLQVRCRSAATCAWLSLLATIGAPLHTCHGDGDGDAGGGQYSKASGSACPQLRRSVVVRASQCCAVDGMG